MWLSNGDRVAADVVILATGWQSSWTGVLDGKYYCISQIYLTSPVYTIEKTAADIGLGKHAPLSSLKGVDDAWNYKTLASPPSVHPDNATGKWVTSVYRGLVPAKNVMKRDFAIVGAMVNLI